MDLNFGFDLSSSQEDTQYDVIIIGGGPAGTTAAIYTSRADLKTLVIDKGLTTGALGITSKIANYPGIGEINGADLVKNMRDQAVSFGTQFIQDRVIGTDLTGEEKVIYTNNGTYTARAVIIATGSMGRGKRVPGEDQLLGHGVSYCATCDAAFFKGADVVVAGNSDEAIEEALFLTRFVNTVHFLSPTPELKAPPELANELLTNSKVIFYTGAVLKEIIGQDKVQAVIFNQREKGKQSLHVSGAFVYLQGGKPITDFLAGQLPISEEGCLLTNNEFQTNLPGVYAIGDVLCSHIKQAVIAAAEGAIAAISIEKVLNGRKNLVVDWSK